MTIDAYLAELARRLPRTQRRRFLAEAEAHLRDAARANVLRGLDPDTAEHAAVESFGAPELVARRLAAVTAVSVVRRASLLALAAIAALVLPLYGIPENTLPPARWDVKPADIAVLQALTSALWLSAVVFAVLGVVLALSRHARVAVAALVAASLTVTAFVVAAVALFARWLAEAPWTPLWPFLVLALPVSVCCLGFTVLATLWGRDHARTLGELLQD